MINNQNGWGVEFYMEEKDGKISKESKTHRHQRTTPKDKDLLKKLSINEGDKILVFAGYYGDWAAALADAGCEVTYSDISKELTEYCKSKFNNKIKNYIVSDYSSINLSEGQYDFTFSFEPISDGAGSLLLGIIRSLVNKKGVILIHYPRKNKPKESYFWMEDIANMFSAKYDSREEFIEGIEQDGKVVNKNHIIRIITSTEDSRKYTELFVKLIRLFNEGERFSLDELSKVVNSTKEDILEVIDIMKKLEAISKTDKFRKISFKEVALD